MSSQACVNVLLCQICAPDLLVSHENSRTLIFPKGKQKKPGFSDLLVSPENSGTSILPKGKLQTNPDSMAL
jgi:hypothetical protein